MDKQAEINNTKKYIFGYIRGFRDCYKKAEKVGFVKGETAGKITEKKNILHNLVANNYSDQDITNILKISQRQLKTMKNSLYSSAE